MEESASRYSDFHTIDWLRDIARDRIRHRSIIKKRTGSVCDKSKSLLDAASGWLIVFLIGVSVGVIAGKWKFNLEEESISVREFWHNHNLKY